jgi:NADH-quinone oxidoreductase subunit L
VNGVGSLTKLFANFNGKFDKYVVDGIVNFVAYFTGFWGLLLRKTQTGRVQTYIAFVVFGVVVLFFVFKGM